jgi:hypothetical protein
MKIPFLPVHIVTTKKLEQIAGEIIKNCDGITAIEQDGRKQYEFSAKQLGILMNNSLAMEQMLARYGVKAPAIGARIQIKNEKKG